MLTRVLADWMLGLHCNLMLSPCYGFRSCIEFCGCRSLNLLVAEIAAKNPQIVWTAHQTWLSRGGNKSCMYGSCCIRHAKCNFRRLDLTLGRRIDLHTYRWACVSSIAHGQVHLQESRAGSGATGAGQVGGGLCHHLPQQAKRLPVHGSTPCGAFPMEL